MDNFFTHTWATVSYAKVKTHEGTDEHPFIADLFNDHITEVGHIQFIPDQDQLRVTCNRADGEQQKYYITAPRLEFLKFIFHNTNSAVKKAVRFYFKHSKNAQEQSAENQRAQHKE